MSKEGSRITGYPADTACENVEANRRTPTRSFKSIGRLITYGRESIVGTLGHSGSALSEYWKRMGAECRTVYINNQKKNRALHRKRTNEVYTSKYKPHTLLPLFMVAQFSRFQNLFFLVTGLIQLTYPQVPGSRWGIIVPLSGVILIALIREIVSERKLWKSDKIANSTLIEYVDDGVLKTKPCGKVEVGDILRIKSGDIFPADMIILGSSDREGRCYIETSNMDGEINLKIRQSHRETMKYNTLESLKYLKGKLVADLPSKSLISFHGKLSVNSYPPDDIGLSQTLLRGARLVKTNWVFGLVIYTGHETKLLMNDTKPTIKRTTMDRTLNVQILALFLYLYLLSLYCTYESAKFATTNPFAKTFLYEDTTFIKEFAYNILIFVLLYNNIVPLSLVITCEMLKVILGRYIDNDQDMYYPPVKKFAFSRSDWLMDDLGLVDNIFCDKTGTLTCNQIKFVAIYASGTLYTDNPELANNKNTCPLREMIDINSFTMLDGPCALAAATVLLCNEAVPTPNENDSSKIDYITPSVDEEALLEATSSYGLKYTSKSFNVATILHHPTGIDTNFEILTVNEFSSFRRRMSVVVRTPTKKIHLYVKGSGESIFSVLSDKCKNSSEYSKTSSELKSFMSLGLRALCLAYRELSEDEFNSWAKAHKDAKLASAADEAVQKSFSVIESNLTLLGFTVSEDKLQDYVSETITVFSKASIKTWILTGDGKETAINIARSCSFIDENMPILECAESKPEDVIKVLNEGVQSFRKIYPPKVEKHTFAAKVLRRISLLLKIISSTVVRFISRSFTKFLIFIRFKDKKCMVKEHLLYKYGKKKFPEQKYAALVITGTCLESIFESDDASRMFLSLAMECSSVVCCSMSPSQKSQVVMLVKNNVKDSVALAVGDGANDVGMIRAAHIGVGINGREGTHASKSSDFAIYQFHHLSKLVIGHGSRSYYSVSSFVLYSFYKNILLYTSQIWYQLYAGFSAQTLYETWSSIASYNLLWMFTQPFIVGVYGRTVTTSTIMQYPSLYKLGHKRVFYNHKKFYKMLANSLITSYLMFYAWRCIYYYGNSSIASDGKPLNCWFMGEMLFTTILTTISLESILYILETSCTIFLFSIGPVIVFMCVFVLYSKYVPKYLNISTQLVGLSGIFNVKTFWLGLLLCAVVRLYVDLLYK